MIKKIPVANTVTLTSANPYLIKINFNDVNNEIEIFNGTTAFSHITSVPLSEDITMNYQRGRLISAGLEIYSDTMPGGVYSISGRMTAV